MIENPIGVVVFNIKIEADINIKIVVGTNTKAEVDINITIEVDTIKTGVVFTDLLIKAGKVIVVLKIMDPTITARTVNMGASYNSKAMDVTKIMVDRLITEPAK